MKAKILKHRGLDGYHGMVLSGTLFRTGTAIVPQLFPFDCDKEWIQRSIKYVDKQYVNSLDDFDLVGVSLNAL